jgi:uncharacterized protein
MNRIFLILLCHVYFVCQSQTLEAFAGSFQQVGIVNDYAGILNPIEEKSLEEEIHSIRRESKIEYAICLLNDLNGFEIKDVATVIGNEWGIGKASKNNGILFLIAFSDQKIFIATGLGIKDYLSDSEVQLILNSVVIPSLKMKNYYLGITSGITQI